MNTSNKRLILLCMWLALFVPTYLIISNYMNFANHCKIVEDSPVKMYVNGQLQQSWKCEWLEDERIRTRYSNIEGFINNEFGLNPTGITLLLIALLTGPSIITIRFFFGY
jgi:hypothetical protein